MVRVSVIVPAFNCEQYISAAVESVLKQDYLDYELLVVDDGSTDGTVQSLEGFRRQLLIIRQQNRGVAAARNAGLRAASGDFVAFLDADDWWFPGRLRAQIKAMSCFPDAGLAFSDFCVSDVFGTVTMKSGIRWKYRALHDGTTMAWSQIFARSATIDGNGSCGEPRQAQIYCGNVAKTLFRGNFINTSSVLVRRGAIIEAGGFDESLGTEEDYDCWLKIARYWSFVYVDQPLVGFRRRPGQLTSSDAGERVARNALTVAERASERMGAEIGQEEIRRRLSILQRDIGVICLRSGRKAEARQFFTLSRHNNSDDFIVRVLSGVTFLPAGSFDWFLMIWRFVRQCVGGKKFGAFFRGKN